MNRVILLTVALLSTQAVFAGSGVENLFPRSNWKLQEKNSDAICAAKLPASLTVVGVGDSVLLLDGEQNLVDVFDLTRAVHCNPDGTDDRAPKGTCAVSWYRKNFANELRQDICNIGSADKSCDTQDFPASAQVVAIDVPDLSSSTPDSDDSLTYSIESGPGMDCTYVKISESIQMK